MRIPCQTIGEPARVLAWRGDARVMPASGLQTMPVLAPNQAWRTRHIKLCREEGQIPCPGTGDYRGQYLCCPAGQCRIYESSGRPYCAGTALGKEEIA